MTSTKLIDISVPLSSHIPLWPSSNGMQVREVMSLENGDEATVSELTCDVHTGTHIDAPRHFVKGGTSIDKISLDVLVGPTMVLYLPNVEAITAKVLEGCSLPNGTKRVLFKTENSKLWEKEEKTFHEDFVALTADAAEWVVEQDLELVGIDYLSIQRYKDDFTTHEILLGAGVVILESVNLSGVEPGSYELCCLPLKLIGAEAAPARAFLRPLS